MIANGSKLDPTRTSGIRRQFEAALKLRYRALKAMIVDLIYSRDVLGLGDSGTPLMDRLKQAMTSLSTLNVRNAEWGMESNPNKVKRFRAWLRGKMDSTLAGDELIQQYIDQGYRRGTERAFDDLRRGGIMTGEGEQADLKRQGAKEEFSRIAMTKSATVEKVKLLAGRTFHELEDVNTKMSARMSRVLVDALVQGWSPAKAARELTKQVDLDISRATVIVRTELVRAHSEGQLDALEMLGETEVGVMAEWITAHDGKVCPRCKALEGQTFSITDARGMLPLHPRCRCAWIPLRKRRGRVR